MTTLQWALILASTLALIGVLIVAHRLGRKRPASKTLRDSEASEQAVLEALLPDSEFLEIDDLSIHYVQAGSGRDLVLLHGLGASVFIWRFLFPLLQTRYRVTALDLPGFGQSSLKQDHDYGLDSQCAVVQKALDKLNINRPILVGSSMGGAIALWLAKLAPDRFQRVITLCPAVDATLVPGHVKHFAAASPLLRRALNRRTMRKLIERVVSRKDLITDSVVDSYLQPFLSRGESVKAFWSATSLLSDHRLPDELKGLTARVLVIWAECDLLVPKKSIAKLLSVLPQAKLIEHPKAGHHIMEDEPEWTRDQIAAFADSTPEPVNA